jgi:hypothetical protein
MKEAVVIDTDADGNKTAKEVHFVYAASVTSDFGEPKTWKEATSGVDSAKWTESSASEIMNFIKRESWKKRSRSEVKRHGSDNHRIEMGVQEEGRTRWINSLQEQVYRKGICRSQELITRSLSRQLQLIHW